MKSTKDYIYAGCQTQEKKLRLREKLQEYMTQAEKVKSLVNKQKDEGKYHEQLHIKAIFDFIPSQKESKNRIHDYYVVCATRA